MLAVAVTAFGARLKAMRTDRGLSQQEVADRVECHVMQISRLENGRQDPSWKLAIRLANALGVSLDAFRGGDEEGKQQAKRKGTKVSTRPAGSGPGRSTRVEGGGR
jgi:transcriptional regulator with XRE-family HTH domain